jgi:hypothetical protein
MNSEKNCMGHHRTHNVTQLQPHSKCLKFCPSKVYENTTHLPTGPVLTTCEVRTCILSDTSSKAWVIRSQQHGKKLKQNHQEQYPQTPRPSQRSGDILFGASMTNLAQTQAIKPKLKQTGLQDWPSSAKTVQLQSGHKMSKMKNMRTVHCASRNIHCVNDLNKSRNESQQDHFDH